MTGDEDAAKREEYRQNRQKAINDITHDNKQFEKKTRGEYVSKTYDKLPKVEDVSISHRLGLKSKPIKIFTEDSNYKSLPAEYHIVPLSAAIGSHNPTEYHKKRGENKDTFTHLVPFEANEKYAPDLQPRSDYGKTGEEGERAREYTINNVAEKNEPSKTNDLTVEGDAGLPIVEGKNLIIGGNGGNAAKQLLTDEQRKKHIDYLYNQLDNMFELNDEQKKQVKKEFDDLYEKGDLPVAERLVKNDKGENLKYDKDADYLKGLASVINPEGKGKGQTDEGIIRGFQDKINDQNHINDFVDIFNNKDLSEDERHKKAINYAVDKGYIAPEKKSQFYGENGITSKGRLFGDVIKKHLYFDKNTTTTLDKIKKRELKKDIYDFRDNAQEPLRNLRAKYPNYDIQNEIRDVLDSRRGAEGQVRIEDEPLAVRGLKHILTLPGNDQKEIFDDYNKKVKKEMDTINEGSLLEDEDEMNNLKTSDEMKKEMKDKIAEFKDNFFAKYAKKFDEGSQAGSENTSKKKNQKQSKGVFQIGKSNEGESENKNSYNDLDDL